MRFALHARGGLARPSTHRSFAVLAGALLFAGTFSFGIARAATPTPAGAVVEAQAAATAAEPASAPPAVPAKTGPTVLILPYQPIFRSVDQTKAEHATNLLNQELAKEDTLVAVRGGVAKDSGKGPTLEEAHALTAAAEKAEAEKNIKEAIAARKKAVDAMAANASAITEASEYALAHHYLARALMWSAKDEEAKKVLDQAARLRPGIDLPTEDFSRLYAAWFKAAVDTAMADKRGELLVRSVLPGARVTLDGREMGVAPVLLTRALPGKHILGAQVEGVPNYATVVEIPAGKKAQFTLNFGGVVGGDAVGVVSDSIAENAMTPAALKSAVEAGKSANARFVVAGGMSRDDNQFNVHTFVVDVNAQKVQSLDLVNFDLDLLTADADVLRVVQAVKSSVSSFKGDKGSVSVIARRASTKQIVTEVIAEPKIEEEKLSDRDRSKGPRQVFGPLKGSKVKIKDED